MSPELHVHASQMHSWDHHEIPTLDSASHSMPVMPPREHDTSEQMLPPLPAPYKEYHGVYLSHSGRSVPQWQLDGLPKVWGSRLPPVSAPIPTPPPQLPPSSRLSLARRSPDLFVNTAVPRIAKVTEDTTAKDASFDVHAGAIDGKCSCRRRRRVLHEITIDGSPVRQTQVQAQAPLTPAPPTFHV